MTIQNPLCGIESGMCVKKLLEADDALAEAQDFANLVSMAFRRSSKEDPDGHAVGVGISRVFDMIEKGRELIEEFRLQAREGRK